MSLVKIVDMPAQNANGYNWRWRSADGRVTSAKAFDLFYDCLADARLHGHDVLLRAAPSVLRPHDPPDSEQTE